MSLRANGSLAEGLDAYPQTAFTSAFCARRSHNGGRIAARRRAAGTVTPETGLNSTWERPTRLERIGLAALFILTILFGGLVEIRSNFLVRRLTDLDVFLRAGWAIRTGRDIYTVTEGHGWHFQYPPVFAIAIAPLADPPPGYNRAYTLPFGVSVVVWYALSVACLAVGVHLLASAVERAAAERFGGLPPPGSRAWWTLRVMPIVAALGPAGFTLSRGQANFIELVALCAMIAAVMARRSYAAGWWLAAAVCTKVIPIYLVVYPIWRRDLKMVAACAAGLALGLVVLPSIAIGPARTADYFREWVRVLVEPAAGIGNDRSRATELLDVNGTDNQSFEAMIHNWSNLEQTMTLGRKQRSPRLAWYERPMHAALAIVFTAITLIAAGWSRRGALDEELAISALMIIMVLSSPASHVHYFVLAIPALIGLFAAARMPRRAYPDAWTMGLLIAFGVATGAPLLPHCEVLGDLGLAVAASLVCWAAALGSLVTDGRASAGAI